MDSSLEFYPQEVEEKKVILSVSDYAANMLRESFQCLTIILLSLLLPLSFIVLARLSVTRYLIATSAYTGPDSLLVRIFLYANPTLHLLAPFVSISALTQCLTGRTLSDHMISKTRLYTSWFFLFTFQICDCIGIEGSIFVGIDGSSLSHERLCLFIRVMFFLGLHETTMFWSKKVVKPVVDDTVFGVETTEDRYVQKVAMGMSFGLLWWCKMRNEVESLVVVAELKRDLMASVDLVDFVCWWLYYVTVAIGMAKVIKAFIWLSFVLCCRNVVDSDNAGCCCTRNDNKV